MQILKTYARVFVADMDAALPIYERLVGAPADLRFDFEVIEVVAVGDFLLVAGTPEAIAGYRDTVGPVVVDDLSAARQLVEEQGGVLRDDVQVGPTGWYFYAKHTDGAEIEYVQWRDDLVERILHS